MDDVYVLNGNLEMIGVVDSYKSLIWANRYRDVGDCELYVPATTDNLSLLKKNNYLIRPNDNMVCIIKKIELTTNAEDGNYIIATGYDVKQWLDQRVVWGTMSANGNAEEFIISMVNDSLGDTDIYDRSIKNLNGDRIFYVDTAAGFTEALTEQVSYKNIGEKIRDYCLRFGWGYRVILDDVFMFQMYNGVDRSNTVFFSNAYENLSTSTYIEDETNMGNVALIAGEGEGSERSRTVAGVADGLERFELFVDAKDISKTISFGDLIDLYPEISSGGQGYISGDSTSGYTYMMNYVEIQIIDAAQLDRLESEYPSGEIITIDGNQYYRVYNAAIADLPSDDPDDADNVVLRDLIYMVYLLTRGYDHISEFGFVTSFEGTVEPNTTFVYKKDYFLGDLVTVENEYGMSIAARITEVVEVNDDSGYSVQPKFEYIKQEA